ncbi:hypothetical protein [Streptomyces mirabilis]
MSARRTPRHGDGGPVRQPAAPDQEFARQSAAPDPEFAHQGRAPHPRRLPPGSRRPRIRALELPSRASHPQGGVV